MGYSQLQRSAQATDTALPRFDVNSQSQNDRARDALLSVCRHRRRDSQVPSLLSSVTSEGAKGLWISDGASFGKSSMAAMPASVLHGSGTPLQGGNKPCLSVNTKKAENGGTLDPQEEVHNFLDTVGTLSPVSNSLCMMSGSPHLEEGLTLFVNPMVFCESADEDALIEGKKPYSVEIDNGSDLLERDQSSAPGDKRNRELRKVEVKMEKQVALAGTGETVTSREVKPAKDCKELIQISATSQEASKLHNISIPRMVLPQDEQLSNTGSTEDRNRGSSGWSFESDQEEWAGRGGNGIGHFREDTMWGGGIRPTPNTTEPPEKYLPSEHNKFCVKGPQGLFADATADAIKEAKFRAFINFQKLKNSRLRAASNQCKDISWSDKTALDAAVERAFKNVKPFALVRKTKSRPDMHALTSESWRRLPSIQDRFPTLTECAWRCDATSHSLWSGEVNTVVSHSTWSEVEDWAPKRHNHNVLNTNTSVVQSRDSMWGGLCVGLLAWLAVFI